MYIWWRQGSNVRLYKVNAGLCYETAREGKRILHVADAGVCIETPFVLVRL